MLFELDLLSYRLFDLKTILRILLKIVQIFYISLIFNQICFAQETKSIGKIDGFQLKCASEQGIWQFKGDQAILYPQGILVHNARISLWHQPIYQTQKYWLNYKNPSIPIPLPMLAYQNQGWIFKVQTQIPIALNHRLELRLGWWQNEEINWAQRALLELKWDQDLSLYAQKDGLILMGNHLYEFNHWGKIKTSGTWVFGHYPMALGMKSSQQRQALFSVGDLNLHLSPYLSINIYQINLFQNQDQGFLFAPIFQYPVVDFQTKRLKIQSAIKFNLKESFTLGLNQRSIQDFSIQNAHFLISQDFKHQFFQQHLFFSIHPSLISSQAIMPIQIQASLQTKIYKKLNRDWIHELSLISSYLYQHSQQPTKEIQFPLLYQSFMPFEQGYMGVQNTLRFKQNHLNYHVYAFTQKQMMADMDLLFYGILSPQIMNNQRKNHLYQKIELSFASILSFSLQLQNQKISALFSSLKINENQQIRFYWQNQYAYQRDIHSPQLDQAYQNALLYLNMLGVQFFHRLKDIDLSLELSYHQHLSLNPLSTIGKISIPLSCQCMQIELSFQRLNVLNPMEINAKITQNPLIPLFYFYMGFKLISF
jgi:hypothetical protein